MQDYIEANMSNALSLEELAAVAGFSKFHFNRIVKGVLKESMLQYVNRLKMEKLFVILLT